MRVWWVDVGSLVKAPFQKVIVADSDVPKEREPKALAVDVVATWDEDLEHFTCSFAGAFCADQSMRRYLTNIGAELEHVV
jgi:hypothetical protein